jgi:hypothetical protein
MSEKRDGEHSMERLGFLAAMSRLPDQFRASAEKVLLKNSISSMSNGIQLPLECPELS